MSDTAQLQALGQQLAAALVASYGELTPGAKLVFLPGGVSVPDTFIQPNPANPAQNLINPEQIRQWLAQSFDSPFVISGDEGTILGKDPSHGSASRIYTVAVTSAQPVGTPGDAAWTRIDREIAAAVRSLGPPDAPKPIVCQPQDWPLPSANAGYWTKFDSTDTQATSTQTTTPVPVVNPQFWMVRSMAVEEVVAPSPPPPPPEPISDLPRFHRRIFSQQRSVAAASPRFSASDLSVSAVEVSPRATVEASSFQMANSLPAEAATSRVTAIDQSVMATARPQMLAWRAAADSGTLPARLEARTLFQVAPSVETVTTSTSSTVTIHLEHQCVSLGYFSAGLPWWDGVFLADPGWFIPGMPRGGLLPAPDGAAGHAYGLPMAMVIVQNLRVSGQWSAEASAALASRGGTLGPLSLFGASVSTAADGVTVTYAHPGMQVVALLCSSLPILPPADPPPPPADPPATTADAGGTPASPSVQTVPPASQPDSGATPTSASPPSNPPAATPDAGGTSTPPPAEAPAPTAASGGTPDATPPPANPPADASADSAPPSDPAGPSTSAPQSVANP